ncbi:MAG: TolC family protein [Bacteroidales bacterium]|nr:TolC family protein [Bacteroidales bacterium]
MRQLVAIVVALTMCMSVFSQEEKWTLQQCVSYALENNLTVSQSYLRQRSSELSYKQSKLNRLPSVNASASQSLLEPTSTSVGLSASMNLFNGLSAENTIKKNKLELDKQSLQTEQVKYDIEISVAEAYIQVLYAKENILLAEKLLETSRKELKIAEAKYKVGSMSKKNYSDIEAQYANKEYSLVRAKNQYSQQLLTLKQLLELEPGASFDIADTELSFAAFTVPSPMEVYEDACKVYPEMKSAEQQLAIDSLSVKIAKSSYFPSLSVSASVGASGDFFDNESEWRGNKSLRMSLSVPIFNRWQTKTNVENVKINSEYNALGIESTRKNLYKSIENACQNAEAYQAEDIALQYSLQSLSNSLELAQKQFEVGLIDATTLLVTETNFAQTSVSQIQAKYMAILNYMVILHYQGKTIEF